MKLARTITIGAAVLGFTAGSALAQDDRTAMDEPLESSEMTYYEIYGVDEDRDGVIDSYLFIEESDTRA
jgi:hypothetical protein